MWCALLCMFLWSVLKVFTFRNDIYIPTHPRYCRFKKAYSKARKGTFIKCEYWAYSYKNFRHCYTQLKLHVALKLVHQRKRLNFICLVQYIYIWVLIRFSILIIASIIYYLCLLLTFKHRFFLHSSVTISIRNVYFHFLVGAYIIYVLMIVFDVFHCFPM